MTDSVTVIGASGALGYGLALRLGVAGIPIVIGSRDAGRAEETAAKLAEEVPDVAPPPGDEIGDQPRGEGEPVDPEAGAERAGRLVAPDEGAHADTTKEAVAADVGIDAGAAGAEEAAVHVVEDDTELPDPEPDR